MSSCERMTLKNFGGVASIEQIC